MSKSIEDLREALFATLQGVKDGSIDVEKARAVNELGKTICDTAKVEVDYIKASGGGREQLPVHGHRRRQPAAWHHGHHAAPPAGLTPA